MKHKFFLLCLSTLLLTGHFAPTSYANDFNCTLSNFKIDNPTPRWSYSMQKDLKILATWSISDPNNCIENLNINRVYSDLNTNNFIYSYMFPRKELPTDWKLFRDGSQVIITALFEISLDWLRANYNSKDNAAFRLTEFKSVSGALSLEGKSKNYVGLISGELSAAKIWAIWFSKLQGIDTTSCDAPKSDSTYSYPKPPLKPKVDTKVIQYGNLPIVQLTFSQTKNCIFLLDTQPIFNEQGQKLYSTAYWESNAYPYFQKIAADESSVIQAATNMKVFGPNFFGEETIDKFDKIIPVKSSVRQEGDNIVVNSQLDLRNASELNSKVGFYLNYYYWYYGGATSTPSGWRITWNSDSSFTARYSAGSFSNPGVALAHNGIFFEMDGRDLLLSPEAKAEADAQAIADKVKAKAKKSTISCIKGSVVKKITAVKPKCPKGFKVKI